MTAQSSFKKSCPYQETCSRSQKNCNFEKSKTCGIAIGSLIGKGICPACFFANEQISSCNVPKEMLNEWEGHCYVQENCFYTLGSEELGDLIHRQDEKDREKAKKLIRELKEHFKKSA